MTTLVLAGRRLLRTEYTKPTSLKHGYRGVLAGSREAGTCSFDLIFRDGVGDGLWFDVGAALEILRDESAIWRGVVRQIIRPNRRGYTVRVECAEDSGRLVDLRCGMGALGQLDNPALFVWGTEPMARPAGVDDRGRSRSGRSVVYRPGGYFETGFAAAQRGYSKRELFDSFDYGVSTGAQGGQIARRRLLMQEQSVSDIMFRLRELIGARGGPEIRRVDVDLTDGKGSPQMYLPILGEDGSRLLPDWDDEHGRTRTYGLFSRRQPGMRGRSGGTATLYWRETSIRDGDQTYPAIELYQLVNHSFARRLGGFIAERFHWNAVYGSFWSARETVHSFGGHARLGPFGVYSQFGDDEQRTVAWFFIWGRTYYDAATDKSYYQRRATVYEVSLESLLDDSGDTVPYQRYELEAQSVSATVTPDWVIGANGSYSLTNSRKPISRLQVERTGGMYAFYGGESETAGPVFWSGDVFLSELGFDCDGMQIADILHNIGLATGTEWWITPDGTLTVRKVRQAVERVVITGSHFVLDDTTLRPSEEAETAAGVTGIPMGDAHLAALQDEISAMTVTMRRRRAATFKPSGYDLPLGCELTVNGERFGKLVSVELDDPLVTVECEV